MNIKLTFRLTEAASIEAVRAMGGFHGSVTEMGRRETVAAHMAASEFRVRVSLASLPATVRANGEAGFSLVKAED